MFKKLGTTAAALLIALTLTACSGPTSGTITAKTYGEPYTWVQYIFSVYNQQGMCTVQVPIFHDEPEKWVIHIHNAEEDKKNRFGVSKAYWDTVQIGDFVNFDEK